MSQRTVDVADLAARMAEKFPEEPRRGRPKGSKNRVEVPSEGLRAAALEHADPTTLVERQFVIAEWLQTAFRRELKRRMNAPTITIDIDDVKRFESITASLDRAVRTLANVDKVAEEMANRLSADQLLDKTLQKIEAQDPAFVRYAVKRLKAYLDKLVPKADPDRVPLGTLAELVAE